MHLRNGSIHVVFCLICFVVCSFSFILTAVSQPSITLYKRTAFQGAYASIAGSEGPSGDDDAINVGLPFGFLYDGVRYDSVRICTNGWVELGSEDRPLSLSVTASNPVLFTTAIPTTVLAPWWDDLSTESGSIQYTMIGSVPDRVFVVEWQNVLSYFGGGTTINFELRLYETTNVIEFWYGSVSGSQGLYESASFGIKDTLGGEGHYIDGPTGSWTTGTTKLRTGTDWPATFYRFVPARIRVERPDGGEYFYIGSTDTIRWRSGGPVNLKLEFSTDAGGSWSVITPSVPAISGSYPWLIPNVTTTTAEVRISDAADSSVFNVSDAPFTIQYPPSMSTVPDSLFANVGERDSAITILTLGNSGHGALVYNFENRYRSARPQQPNNSLNGKGSASLKVKTPTNFPAGRKILQNQHLEIHHPCTVRGTTADSTIRILTIDLGIPENYLALDSLGLVYTKMQPADFDTVDFNHYDVLYVGWTYYASETGMEALYNRRNDIMSFVQSGGGLVALSNPTTSSLAWQWVPATIVIRDEVGDSVHVSLPGHPVMHSLVDTSLSDWHLSYINLFDQYDSYLTPLAVGIGGSDHPVTLAGVLGAGRVVLTGQDPDYHYAYAGEPGAGTFLMNMLRWTGRGAAGWLSETPGGGSIDGESTGQISVQFNAIDLFPGDYLASIIIHNNDPIQNPKMVPVRLHVFGYPIITVVPDSMDYGAAFIGYGKTDTMMIGNSGSDDLLVNGVVSDNPLFTVDSTNFVVPVGSVHAVLVTYNPIDLTQESGNITISSNDSTRLSMKVPLKGHGAYPPSITVVPDSFQLSMNESDSLTRVLTIGNSGAGDLHWRIGGSDGLTTSGKIKKFLRVYQLPTSSFVTHGDPDLRNKTTQHSSGTSIRLEKKTFTAPFSDLSGVRILFDDAHANDDTSIFSILLSDLRSRGATLDVNSGIFTLPLLNNYDVVIITEGTGIYSPAELSDLRTWVNNGGGLFIEGDSFGGNFDAITLPYGIQYTGQPGTFGFTTDIVPHFVTAGCDTIFLSGPVNSLTVNGAAEMVVKDPGGHGHVAVASYGYGNVMVVADDDFFGDIILQADNRALGNNGIDWLAKRRYWLAVIPDSGTVAPGLSQDVSVILSMKNLYAGDYNTKIEINNDDPRYSQKSVPVHLHLIGRPSIAVSPDSIDFGSAFINYDKIDTLAIKNLGSQSLNISTIASDDSHFLANLNFVQVPPHGETVMLVKFLSGDTGYFHGVLSITSNDSIHPVVTVPVQCRAVYPPAMTVAPDSFVVSLNEGDSTTGMVTIGNTGLGELRWAIGGPLPPSTIGKIRLPHAHYIPVVEPMNTPLFIAQQPASHSTPKAVNQNQTEFSENFESGTLSPVWYTNPNHSSSVTSATAANGTVYSLTQTRLANNGHFDGVHTDFPGIQPKSVSFWIRVGNGMVDSTEAAAYFVLGDSNVTANLGAFWFMARGDGRFILYPYDASVLYTTNTWYHIQFLNIDWVSKTFDYYLNDRLIVPGLLFRSLVTADFSELHLYSYSPGVQAWWDEIRIGGTEVSALSYLPDTGSIAPGEMENVLVKMNAAGLDGGDYRQPINIFSNDPVRQIVSVPVHLHVIGRPMISVVPDTINFGTAFIGYGKTDNVIVRNNGSDSLLVGNIISSDSIFKIDTTSFMIPKHSDQKVFLKFNPTILGHVVGQLSVYSNDSTHPILNVPLMGEGVNPPNISVDPDSISVALGQKDSVKKSVTIGNSGTGDLHWKVVAGKPLKPPVHPRGSTARDGLLRQYSLPAVKFGETENPDEKSGKTQKTTTVAKIFTQRGNEERQLVATDLTGLNILFDQAHLNTGDTSTFSIFLSDLRNRGVQVLVNTVQFDSILLSSIDVVIITESNGIYYPGELSALQSWVALGGGLFIEGDSFSGNFDSLTVPYGIQYTGVSGLAGFTTDIVPHFVTVGCDTIYLSGPVNSLVVNTNATMIVRDKGGSGHVAVAEYGSGKVMVVADDDFYGTYILDADNRTLANNGVGWLALNQEWFSVSPDSGTVAPNQSENLTLTVNAQYLNTGTYEGNFTISNDDPVKRSVSVVVWLTVTTGVKDMGGDIPREYALLQNYPNPFNPSTIISFALPRASRVDLAVYTILGQRVKVLFDGIRNAGRYEIEWNPAQMASGLYFYRIVAFPIGQRNSAFTMTQKMIYTK